ncbi:hypothetical protein GDO81_013476 [Engystomops pustulosus]|uniref:Uncharacterized protein n=1 Tax=Engystomops pustulosus TaxID=76066 RepID=A0AAV7B440_ENGPU|nr:hypothetical protein GDO81_013476 [Engystomops pustulosus]
MNGYKSDCKSPMDVPSFHFSSLSSFPAPSSPCPLEDAEARPYRTRGTSSLYTGDAVLTPCPPHHLGSSFLTSS